MKQRKLISFCLLLLGLTSLGHADFLFKNSTEDSTKGWAPISIKLAKNIIAFSDSAEWVEETIVERKLKRDPRQFFRSHRVQLSTKGTPYFFIRPASSPYYRVFYGAHTFFYWLTDARGEVLFSSASDRFAILPSQHKGMRDIQVSQCRTSVCFSTRLEFDGSRYVERECSTEHIADGTSGKGCQ